MWLFDWLLKWFPNRGSREESDSSEMIAKKARAWRSLESCLTTGAPVTMGMLGGEYPYYFAFASGRPGLTLRLRALTEIETAPAKGLRGGWIGSVSGEHPPEALSDAEAATALNMLDGELKSHLTQELELSFDTRKTKFAAKLRGEGRVGYGSSLRYALLDLRGGRDPTLSS